jgi:NAD(P)-dependent dehydrogenase (short-subunit alcohol dehydrogenase family)
MGSKQKTVIVTGASQGIGAATLSPMGTIASSKEIADAVVYLTEAHHVTGEVLHVDGGAHVGRW